MSNSLLVRSLIMYGFCVVVAIFIGYQLSSWDERLNFNTLMAVLFLMMLPFLLKWHHFWLIATWNTYAMVFFLSGRPTFMLVLGALSLMISLIEHGIKQEAPFIKVSSVWWPLVFLTCVILATAKLRGGIGLSVAGSANVGGKKYFYALGGVVGYLALTAQRIPREKVMRYTTAFLISPVTNIISDISLFIAPSAIYYIYLIFPYSGSSEPAAAFGPAEATIQRLAGTAGACSALVYTMAARYGLSGIFGGRVWRAPVFLLLFGISMLGGYRGTLITFALICFILFWLEGLYRSRLMPVLVCGLILGGITVFVSAEHLPLSMQRTLSVVPFIKVSNVAAESAKASSDWRVKMWHEVVPTIPQYLLVGKGYSISVAELAKVNTTAFGDEGAAGNPWRRTQTGRGN